MNALRRLAALFLVLMAVTGPTMVPGISSAEADPVGEWPLQPQPEVVAGFDPPDSAWGPGHRGVDLLGHVGQEVHASLPGRVTFAGMLAGRGVVVVGHGDTRTTYEPVTGSVEVGGLVARGAVIGTLEGFSSHCSPRACLHWGWLRGTTYLDPLRLVGRQPVRLLPLWRAEPVEQVPLDQAVVTAVPRWSPGPWILPYAAVIRRLAVLVARSPPF